MCKTDEQIGAWLARKFILVLQNEIRFNQIEYGEDRVIKESVLTWWPVPSTRRDYIGVKTKITDVDFQDSLLVNLNQWSVQDTKVYGFYQYNTRPYEHENRVHFAIAYELDLNHY